MHTRLHRKNMKFLRHEFLEFFDDKSILDEEIGRYEWNLNVGDFVFKLYVVQCDDYANICLKYKNLNTYAFDIGLRNITDIKIEKNNSEQVFLNFYKEEVKHFEYEDASLREPFLKVLLIPRFHCNILLIRLVLRGSLQNSGLVWLLNCFFALYNQQALSRLLIIRFI